LCSLLVLHNYAFFCGWQFDDSLKIAFVADPQIEGLHRAQREDTGNFSNYYNDYYQRHIISSIVYFLRPQYVAVLGDIFSSQYISDDEFYWRVERFQWIFSDVIKANIPLINVTGNHDIGYGNEISKDRVQRWQRYFGPVNYLLPLYDHNFVVLNSLNLDSSRDKSLQKDSYHHLDLVAGLPRIVLLTHVPLFKDPSPCNDQPFIEYDTKGFVRQQNFLSQNTTQTILSRLKPLFIFNGHDHIGCKYLHGDAQEITVRSVMGDYSGNIVLFEIAKLENGQYSYGAGNCVFVPLQLISVIVIAVIVVMLGLVLLCCLQCILKSKQS